MATTKSYTQDIQSQNAIRIGSVRLFIAPLPPTVAAYNETKFNTATPPSGWLDLGATNENTVVEATKEVFSLKTGVLKTTKFQAVIGLEGSISAELLEYNAAALVEAIGAQDAFTISGGKKIAVGTSTIRQRQLVAVHDTIAGDGTFPQVVFYFPKVQSADAFRPTVGNDRESVKIPIKFSAYGTTDNDANDTIVFSIYEFLS